MSAMVDLAPWAESPLDTHRDLIEQTITQQSAIATRQLRRWISEEDVAQELRWWCQGHETQIRNIFHRTDGDVDYRARVLHVAFKRQSWKVVTKFLAQLPPTHEAQAVLDQVAYSATFIVEHLSVLWDPQALHERPQRMAEESADRVRTTRSPKTVDDWRLWILDLQQAYARLPKRWRSILLLLEHGGVTQDELASALGISQARVSQIKIEAIQRMARDLSGERRQLKSVPAVTNQPRRPRPAVERGVAVSHGVRITASKDGSAGLSKVVFAHLIDAGASFDQASVAFAAIDRQLYGQTTMAGSLRGLKFTAAAA